MPREFKLPDVGEGVAEGELLEWHVAVGDRVTEDQVVAEVETDKAVVDVPAPVNGTVRELRAQPGDVVPVGDVIIVFDAEGEDDTDTDTDNTSEAADGDPEADTSATTTGDSGESAGDGQREADERVFAAPSTRQLARELGVDLQTIAGSGPGGRITEGDVRGAADGTATAAGDDTQADGEASGDDDRDDDSGLKSAVTRIEDDGGDTGDATTATDATTTMADETGAVEAADRERTLATPSTRTVADDLGVDIDSMPASEQRDGEAFVSEAAVREYAEAQQRAQAADQAALASAGEESDATETVGHGGHGEASTTGTGHAGDRERREPYSGVRRTIGKAMERSKYTAPHVTHHDTVDVTDLVAAHERLKARAAERDIELTYTPLVMKAVVAALADHPIMNTALDEDNEEIVYRNYYNIGVATATDAGLMVPVVDDVDEKSLLQVASETNELVAEARDRSIAREAMQDGTFTITNFGAIGGEYATPIINHPETAILGLGAIEQRPVVREVEDDGFLDEGESTAKVVPAHTLPLSLAIDHRVIDGAEAAQFTNAVKSYLADPTKLLL